MSTRYQVARFVLVGVCLTACPWHPPNALAAAACGATPATSCHEADRATITLRDPGPGAKAKLVSSWRALTPVPFEDLGDPVATTAYRLCIYDEAAGAVGLAGSLLIAPGALWREQPGRAFTYVDRARGADGVKRIVITTGGLHDARVKLVAAGSGVPLPGPASVERYFAQTPAVTVQLANDTGACWTARFTDAERNDATSFVARARHTPPTGTGKRAFVSSTCHDGALGGLGAADAECQALADTASLNGTFQAWLADGSESPSTRFAPTTGRYVRTDGVPLAESWSDLVDGTLAAPIALDETGAAIVPTPGCATKVWTNVQTDGSVAVTDGYEFVCQNWTVALFARSALTGDASSTGAGWTDGGPFGTQSCGLLARLYCFEQ